MATETLKKAKKNKADEFYTQMIDIENELKIYVDYNPDVFKNKTILCPCDDPYESNFFKYFLVNFNRLGLKKLISTCYAGHPTENVQITLFGNKEDEDKISRKAIKVEISEVSAEYESVTETFQLDELLVNTKNKLTELKGDGDFRSQEITALLKKVDFIITNPPFSLFREFITWIVDANKQFLIIGNINSITYKEVFPLIKDNQIWMGLGFGRSFKGFIVPDTYHLNGTEARVDEQGNRIVSTNNTIWLTNIEHNHRHKPLNLDTMENNLKFSKHKKVREKDSYDMYDNYNAIDVPFTDAIPSDYNGTMGVPISFLHKYCPEQFEIVKFRKGDDGKDLAIKGTCPYFRILIRNRMNKTHHDM